MTAFRFEQEWRSAEPAPDFAHRVVLEHERQGRTNSAVMACASKRPVRQHPVRKHNAPLVVLGLAALLISGAAAASLGPSWLPKLDDTTQEGRPIEKPERPAPRFLLVSSPAPMEREQAKVPERAVPAVPKAKPAAPVPEAPARPVPIHYPACQCSSGAVVCSCVD